MLSRRVQGRNLFGRAAIGTRWGTTINGMRGIGLARPMQAHAGSALATTASAFTTAIGRATTEGGSTITAGIVTVAGGIMTVEIAIAISRSRWRGVAQKNRNAYKRLESNTRSTLIYKPRAAEINQRPFFFLSSSAGRVRRRRVAARPRLSARGLLDL